MTFSVIEKAVPSDRARICLVCNVYSYATWYTYVSRELSGGGLVGKPIEILPTYKRYFECYFKDHSNFL